MMGTFLRRTHPNRNYEWVRLIIDFIVRSHRTLSVSVNGILKLSM